MKQEAFNLTSINQMALPYTTMADGASSVRITSGTIVLGDTDFHQVLAFTGPASAWQSPTQGTYVAEPNGRVTFRVSTGAIFEGWVHPDGRLEYVVQGRHGPLAFRYES